MPVYRYYTEDLMTGTLLDELPGLYGTYMSGNMSTPGDWTATIRMDNDFRSVQDILDVTMPGRTVVWCERDGQPIWGGILWSRTYASEGRTMQFQARTFDSYLGKDFCDVDLNLTDYKYNLVREFFRRAFEVGSYAPIGWLDIPAVSVGDGDVTYNKVLTGTDATSWQDAVEEQTRSGVEYRIRYYKDDFGNRRAALDIGRWDLSAGAGMIGAPADASTRLVFQYPGEIARYWWPESVADAANVLAGVGKANDASTPRVTVTNSDSLNSGYPRLRERFTYSEIENVNTLTRTMNAVADVLNPPTVRPTFALRLTPDTEDAEFGNWALGDFVDYALNDEFRFPSVRKGSTRITNWTLTPASSDGPEEVGIGTTDFNAQLVSGGEG